MLDKKGNDMTKKALVPIASGSEEIEVVTIIDILRRAGVEVTVATCNLLSDMEIIAAQGTKIVAETSIDNCVNTEWDLIAIPGGVEGSNALAESELLTQLLHRQVTEGKFYAAICAAPALVLGSKGLLDNKTATCHPHFYQVIVAKEVDTESRVVVVGNSLKIQRPGTAIEFSF
jgi:4-methyl-5(b-hydroxyethyl)-thiazole monophosphate biosynthesis